MTAIAELEAAHDARSRLYITGRRCDGYVLSNLPPPVERSDSGFSHDGAHVAQV